jgi:hypothetical protein
MGEVDKGCPDKGAVKAGKCKAYLWEPLYKASCTCPGWKCFQAHSCLLFLFFISFSFKKLIRGHCPGVVTSGGNVTHRHFHGNEKVGS